MLKETLKALKKPTKSQIFNGAITIANSKRGLYISNNEIVLESKLLSDQYKEFLYSRALLDIKKDLPTIGNEKINYMEEQTFDNFIWGGLKTARPHSFEKLISFEGDLFLEFRDNETGKSALTVAQRILEMLVLAPKFEERGGVHILSMPQVSEDRSKFYWSEDAAVAGVVSSIYEKLGNTINQ